MSSKFKAPAGNKSSPVELQLLSAIHMHQIEAARTPKVGTRVLLRGAEFAGRPIRAWSNQPTLAKLINDALQPIAD